MTIVTFAGSKHFSLARLTSINVSQPSPSSTVAQNRINRILFYRKFPENPVLATVLVVEPSRVDLRFTFGQM